MKLNIGDIVTVKSGDASLMVRVEDASKGDVIMAKVEELEQGAAPLIPYEKGKVYEFDRKYIQS